MPHTGSAKKRLRQGKKRRLHNREIKKDFKIQTKKFLRALEEDDKEAMESEFRLCAKQLDRAGAKRIYHPNKVARRKSQLAGMLNAKTSQAES